MKSTETETSTYARFEKYPRRNLTFEKTRRDLFRSFFQEAQVTSGRLAGGKGYNLAALGALADDLMGQIKPEIISGCRIHVQDDMVWGQPPKEPERFLFSTNEAAVLIAFNQFNGQTSLLQIASHLSAEMGWTTERCFSLVRGLFLTLVTYRLAKPAVNEKA